MKPADTIAAAVHAEQLAALFRQMPIALGVNIVNAALTAAVLERLAPRPLPFVWFAAVILVTAGRGWLWRRWRRNRAAFAPRRWSTLAALGGLLGGLCWGIGGALILPTVPALAQAFLIVVICGMCAGSIVVAVPHPPSLFAFVLSAALPIAARLFGQGSATGAVLGLMALVFAAALTLGGRQLSEVFAEAMRLRFELDDAHSRLQSEMAERQMTEAALHQAQKLEAIGRLTGGIAHDFNNLCTVALGNLTLARDRASGHRAILPLVEGALQAVERGARLVQHLLGFARQQRLDPQPVDLERLLAGIETLLARTLGPAVRLTVEAETGLAAALVDAGQVELAILNLAINARDAMPEGGHLQITLGNRRAGAAAPAELAPGDYVLLSVADTGLGMDEATLARAFDPFFTTKEPGGGSGLGLPTVQGFAAQSGGAVRIRSRPDAGTTVELWLPRAEAPAPDPASVEPAAVPAPAGAANILLCDDDDDVRQFVGEFLQSVGYAVHQASGPQAALALLDRQTEIDLLIVDYAMPGMNGLETIRQARERRPGLKPLLITGHAGAVGGSTAGVKLLRKPFAPADLARTVAEMLVA